MTKDDIIEDSVRLLRQYGRCDNCFFGKFDHGSGEGFVITCIPDDRNNPPHRYCPCVRCGGTGLDPTVQEFFNKLGVKP